MQNQSNVRPDSSFPKADSTASSLGGNGQGYITPTPTSTIAKVDETRSGVPREVHSFLAEIEHLITAMTSLTGEDLAKAKAKLSARVTATKKSVEEFGGAVVGKARTSATVTNKYVHEQPWNAVGIGAVVGFVLGVVLARRN